MMPFVTKTNILHFNGVNVVKCNKKSGHFLINLLWDTVKWIVTGSINPPLPYILKATTPPPPPSKKGINTEFRICYAGSQTCSGATVSRPVVLVSNVWPVINSIHLLGIRRGVFCKHTHTRTLNLSKSLCHDCIWAIHESVASCQWTYQFVLQPSPLTGLTVSPFRDGKFVLNTRDETKSVQKNPSGFSGDVTRRDGAERSYLWLAGAKFPAGAVSTTSRTAPWPPELLSIGIFLVFLSLSRHIPG
jgi:hypothetical protein